MPPYLRIRRSREAVGFIRRLTQWLVAVHVALWVVVCGVRLSAQASCADCVPAIDYPSANWSGNVDICFKKDQFSSGLQTTMTNAIQSTSGQWLQNMTDVRLNFREGSDEGDCTGADVVVQLDEDLAGTSTLGEAAPWAGIHVNPDVLSCGQDCQKIVAAHEMMHVLGFGEAPGGCNQTTGYTLMIPHFGQSFSAPYCADLSALTKRFVGSNTYDSDEQYRSSGQYEDCFDIVIVHYTFWYDLDANYHESYWEEVIDWTCDPLPAG